MKTFYFTLINLIFFGCGLNGQWTLEEFRAKGLDELSVNAYFDLFVLSRSDREIESLKMKVPLNRNEAASQSVAQAIKVLRDEEVFFKGSHPALWAATEQASGASISFYFVVRFNGSPFYIRSDLLMINGRWHTERMQLYRSDEELMQLDRSVTRLPFQYEFTPVHFGGRPDKKIRP